MDAFDNAQFRSQEFPASWEVPPDVRGRILVGGLDSNRESYYLLDFDCRRILNCTVDESRYRQAFSAYLRDKVPLHKLPYGSVSHDAAVMNFLQPHEGLQLRDGRALVALHNASFIREIDFEQRNATHLGGNQGFVPQMLSATNSLDASGERYYYAVTDMDQRLQVYRDGPAPLDTRLLSQCTRSGSVQSHVALKTSEVIHEVKVCPDDRHVALTEFFLATPGAIPPLHDKVFEYGEAWSDYERQGLYASSLYLADLQNGCYTSTPVNNETPGHIEFSLASPDRFYLSCHNLSKLHGKLILHGTGSLLTGSIATGAARLAGGYSDDRFYRVTSHKVFQFQGRRFIAATVFPNRFYLLSDPEMRLERDVELYGHAPIEPGRLHFCTLLPHMPLWLETSDDGRYVMLISNQDVYLHDVAGGSTRVLRGFNFAGPFMGTAHTTNLNDFPGLRPVPASARRSEEQPCATA